MTMELSWADAIGLVAPVLFLFAYAMISLGKWKPEMLRFQLFNLIGAILILVSLTEHWNLPVFILETCWGLISVYGVVKAINRMRHSPSP